MTMKITEHDFESHTAGRGDNLLLGLVTVTGLSVALWTSLITAVVMLA